MFVKINSVIFKNLKEEIMNEQGKQQKAFDKSIGAYEYKMNYTFTGMIHHIIKEESIKLLDPRAGEKILDIGCGCGEIAIMAAEKGAIVRAFDISNERIALAKKRAENKDLDVSFYVGDSQKINEEESSFDKVMCINVVHRLSDPAKCLSGIFKSLKKDGLLIIFTMNNYSPQFFLVKFYSKIRDMIKKPLSDIVAKKGFTSSQIRNLLEKNGFRVISLTTDIFCFPYFPTYCPKIVNWFLKKMDCLFKKTPLVNKLGALIKIEVIKK